MVFPQEQAAADAMAAHILQRVSVVRRPFIQVRAVKCGRWHEKSKAITLPVWLWDDAHRNLPRYLEWYVAHELAHWLMDRPGHDIHFQTMLAWLAPDAWHWESTYKPKLYSRALTALTAGSERYVILLPARATYRGHVAP